MKLILSDILMLSALCLFFSTLFITIKGIEAKGPEIEGNPLMRFCLANPEVGYPIIAILTTIWVIGYLYLRTRKPKYALVLSVFLFGLYLFVFLNDFTKAGLWLLKHG